MIIYRRAGIAESYRVRFTDQLDGAERTDSKLDDLLLIDLVRPTLLDESEHARMIRRPVRSRFDVALLQEWLGLDGERRASQKPRWPSNGTRSLETLMAAAYFKLLDVYSGEIIVVHEAKTYAALSYVWGKSMAHYAAASLVDDAYNSRTKIEAANLDLRVEIERLPQTLRDAVSLVQQIGTAIHLD